jgi:hypothetical protein
MKNKKNSGISLIKVLILGFIFILVLSFFNISIREVVESPDGQDNINYVKGTGVTIWEAYLKKPLSYLWNDVFVDIFWQSFISNMERIRDGKPTDYELAAPVLILNQQTAP